MLGEGVENMIRNEVGRKFRKSVWRVEGHCEEGGGQTGMDSTEESALSHRLVRKRRSRNVCSDFIPTQTKGSPQKLTNQKPEDKRTQP